MVGAVAGTPGTLPTNWNISGLGTLTQQVVGTGTSNGIAYIDLRFSGTTSTTQLTIRTEAVNGVAAVNGQTWAHSLWCAVVGGSTANITSTGIFINLYDSVPNYLATVIGGSLNTTSTLTRTSAAGTLSNASVAFVQQQIAISFNSGVAIDITLRIGLPQLELGAFATSVIPTTTAATTRSADIASIGTLSPWYNATEGTLFAEWSSVGSLSDSRIVYALSDGTFNNVNYLTAATAAAANQSVNTIRSSNTAQATIAVPGAYTNYTDRKTAAVYKVNDFAISGDGSAVAVDTSGLLPVGVDRLALGTSWIATSNFLSGYLRRITYTPRRLTNAELQSLTS
jgi:hypothetical protein